MAKYQYTIDKTLIEISEADEDSQYEVFQQNVSIGYIYVSELDDDLGVPIWSGSSPYLNFIAAQLGAYIEEVDM